MPADFATIKEAIYAAKDGDSIEVEDGFYFETNILISKKIKLKSKNLFGAVLDGSGDKLSRMFLIQAETEISGFILKNAGWGISQRYSPDVSWTCHDLAILNMRNGGIEVNQVSENFGRALLYNIIVDNSKAGFSTNDAYGIDVKNCLVTNCECAFVGSNHIYFNVNQTSVWNCSELCDESIDSFPPPATNRINLGEGVIVLDPLLKDKRNEDRYLQLFSVFNPSEDKSSDKARNIESLAGLTLNIAGDVYFQLKEYNKSAEFYNKSLIIGKKIASPEIIWHAFYGLGINNEINGQPQKALDNYKKAIEVIESVRSELPSMEYKSGFLKDKLEVYESLVNLLFRLNHENPSKGYDKEAFYFTEKSKSRAFLDELQEARIELQDRLSVDMKNEKREILREISTLQIRLQEPTLSAEKRQKLLSSLDEAEIRYKGFLIKAKLLNQNVSSPIYSQPYGYEQVREKLLNEETALLEYMIGEKNSFAFLATFKNLFVCRLEEPESLSSLVSNYLYFLTLKETGSFKGESGSKRLCRLLLGVFGKNIGKNIKKLVIAPDGVLNLLPFETLIQEEIGEGIGAEKLQGKNSRFLIHNYEISYTPSASSLINILERKIAGKRSMDLLVIANPKADLPHAAKEAKTIARFFDNEKRIVLLNENATEERLKEINLSEFKIIHFATHAVVDDENWWRSALILLPGKDLSEDGQLLPWEIHDLKLNSDLAVLSACQTGRGKPEKGEGMICLARAFLYAGSSSVVSTLWSINDKSTSQLMKYFYQSLSEGKSKGAALCLAKLKMANSRYSHPYHWAAFILIGDYISSLNK